MTVQVSARSAVLTQDDFQAAAPSGVTFSAHMVTALGGDGRVTVQQGQQTITLMTGDLEALLELVKAAQARHELYRTEVTSEPFTTSG